MISWIQSTFQRHLKLVMAMLIIVMFVPLVFIYSTSGGIGHAETGIKERKIFGKPYTSDQDRREFSTDAQISLQLATGQMFFSPDQAEYYGYFRAAKLSLADKLAIPAPTQRQLEQFIMTLPAFIGEDGKYDPQAYTRFLDSTRTNPGAQARISRVVAEDWRANRATELFSGPGFALDPEVREQIAMTDTVWTVHRATLPIKDIKPEGEPSEAEMQQFFDMNAGRYRIPPTVHVSAVDFPADRFAAQVQPPTDDDIVRYFEANKQNYRPAPKEGEQESVVGEARLEDVRDRVIEDMKQQRAVAAATKAASDFAYIIFDKKIARGTPEFDALLRSFATSIRPMPPLPAVGRDGGNPLMREARILSEDKPVSDPVVLGTIALVLFFDGRDDARDAEFSMVRERVKADVQENRRVQAVVARGEEIRAQVAAAVKAGSSFSDAAKAAGLEVKSWENFTRRNLPEDFDTSMPGQLIEQPVGEVSPMTVRGEEGVFVFIAQRKEPAVTSDDPHYAEARRAILENNSRMAAQMLLTEMVRAELVAAGLERAEDTVAR